MYVPSLPATSGPEPREIVRAIPGSASRAQVRRVSIKVLLLVGLRGHTCWRGRFKTHFTHSSLTTGVG